MDISYGVNRYSTFHTSKLPNLKLPISRYSVAHFLSSNIAINIVGALHLFYYSIIPLFHPLDTISPSSKSYFDMLRTQYIARGIAFHYSIIPLFHHSIIPSFQYSIIPAFQPQNFQTRNTKHRTRNTKHRTQNKKTINRYSITPNFLTPNNEQNLYHQVRITSPFK